jgi:hypothetical protein
MSRIGAGIGLGIGGVASAISIYIFFHKGYHIPCLRWQTYVLWFLSITGGLTLVAIVPYGILNIPGTTQTGQIIADIFLFFCGASLIWVAHRRQSLQQQIEDSVRSILRGMRDHQIVTTALVAYLQDKYACPEATLNHYLGEMKDIEQIAIPSIAIHVYHMKQRRLMPANPQVLKNDPNITPPLPPTPARELTKVVSIFFCYAREDEELLNKLKRHLRPLQRQGLIDVWYDRDISAGTEWEKEIDKHLNKANIILLLISPDFMDSEYCYGIEMKRALERHEQQDAIVIPVILRPVYWQGVLGNLQALPTNAKPVKSWPDQDEALYDVAEGIRKGVEEMTKRYSK